MLGVTVLRPGPLDGLINSPSEEEDLSRVGVHHSQLVDWPSPVHCTTANLPVSSIHLVGRIAMPRASVDRPPEKDVRTTKNLEQDRLAQLDQNRFEGVLETVFRQAPVFEPLLWLPLLPSDRAGGVVLSP